MTKQLIRDANSDRAFKKNGFLKMSLLSPATLNAISAIFKKYETEHQRVAKKIPFHSTQDSAEAELNRKVDQELKTLLAGELEKHFCNYRLLMGSFLIKEPGPDSALLPHQDWNFTNESEHICFNIWIPVEATTIDNGALRILPGSHAIIPTIRPNYVYPWAFEAAADLIHESMQDVKTQPGECVLINHAVIHGSHPNFSDKPRVAAALCIVPKEAEVLHYICDDGKTLEQYRLEPEDLFSLEKGVRPPSDCLKFKGRYEFPKVSSAKMKQWLLQQKKGETETLPARLFKNPDYAESLNRLGCCLLPLASEESCEKLMTLFREKIEKATISGLYANHNKNMVEQNAFISKAIHAILEKELNAQFENYDYFIGHFMVKSPHTTEEFSLHQDWNIVDENRFSSYQVWIPLATVDHANGGLFFLPGSHRLYDNYRSGSFGLTRVASDEIIAPYVAGAVIPKGTAFVYSNALFHASHPNLSDQFRVSLIVNIVQKNTPSFYFHKNIQEQTVDCFKLGSDDLLQHLPSLEKGLVPHEMTLADKVKPEQFFDNAAVTSKMLSRDLDELKLQDPAFFVRPALHIAKDRDLEAVLHTQGYVQLPFLNRQETDKLQKLFEAHCDLNSYERPRYTSLEFADFETRNIFYNAIRETIAGKLDLILKNYKIPILQFFVKMPSSDGDINFHTDTTLLLNPHLEPHYAVWIPLQDVDEHNGTITVVPESHLWYNGISSPFVTWSFLPYLDNIRERAVNLNIKAGQLIIFDNRLIHSSTFNTSSKPRISVAGRVTHQLSKYYSFYKKEGAENIFSIFEEPDNLYLDERWSPGQITSPTGRYAGEITQPSPSPSLIEI